MSAVCDFYHLDKLNDWDILNKLSDMVEKERYTHGDINLDNYKWKIGLGVYRCLKTSFLDDLQMNDTCSVCISRHHDDKICGIEFEVLIPNVLAPYRVELCEKPKLIKEDKKMDSSLVNNMKSIQIIDKNRYQDNIKKVIFNDPATIVFWTDGTKTVVKADSEKFDPEKGLAMAITKKYLGNQGNYYNILKKWLPKEEKPETTTKYFILNKEAK